jgi:hypothetical protein
MYLPSRCQRSSGVADARRWPGRFANAGLEAFATAFSRGREHTALSTTLDVIVMTRVIEEGEAMQSAAANLEAQLVKQGGIVYEWGPQAWIDMWISNTMWVKKAMPIISHTFIPILRLTADTEQIDLDYPGRGWVAK